MQQQFLPNQQVVGNNQKVHSTFHLFKLQRLGNILLLRHFPQCYKTTIISILWTNLKTNLSFNL